MYRPGGRLLQRLNAASPTMFLKYFYDKALAHASYLVGCQRTGEAIVIDPSRHIEPYLEAAAAERMRIVAAAETHIHADFVSGSRELADRAGAKLYLSATGPAEWQYQFTDRQPTQLLRDGDSFAIGGVKFDVLHTPGHTPESISFLLTDAGGGATAPMGIFTGDFVFVGAVGRPDLLETAAGVAGSAVAGAHQLFHSLKRFRALPDHLQVWPAHGAGSACGKGLGAVPSSTVGYEKLFNPGLQYADEEAFVAYILADQPETPFYFATMKRVNKVGPTLIRELPATSRLEPNQLASIAAKHLVIDTGAATEFAKGHVPGTINLPAASLVQWAGFFADDRQTVYLITDERGFAESLRGLRSIGVDHVGGYFDSAAVQTSGQRSASYANATPQELRSRIESGEVALLDVRADAEFRAGHIPAARHEFLGYLLRDLPKLDRSKPVVAQCLGGGRSAIAASILKRGGFDVINMLGGYQAWVKAGFPITRP